MKKAMVAGHICLDIAPVFSGKTVESVSELLKPGKLVQTAGVDIHTGGAVANTGLAMKILGADVSLRGKIGSDAFGDIIMGILSSYGASGGMLRVPGESTSYSVVLSLPGLDRMFLHDPGANNTFVSADIPAETLEGISLFHFGYPPVMRNMFMNNGDELTALFKRMKARGIATSLDFTQIDPESEAGHADWTKILARVLPFTDFFLPSVEELCFMIDRPRFEKWQQRAAGGDVTLFLDAERDIRPLAEQCLAMGAKVVVIKSGAPGMYYAVADETSLAPLCHVLDMDVAHWAGKAGFQKSYAPEKVVSGTGAGDTSIAAFLTAVLDGASFETALKLAAATGACCVEAVDALSGLKDFDTLRKRFGIEVR